MKMFSDRICWSVWSGWMIWIFKSVWDFLDQLAIHWFNLYHVDICIHFTPQVHSIILSDSNAVIEVDNSAPTRDHTHTYSIQGKAVFSPNNKHVSSMVLTWLIFCFNIYVGRYSPPWHHFIRRTHIYEVRSNLRCYFSTIIFIIYHFSAVSIH